MNVLYNWVLLYCLVSWCQGLPLNQSPSNVDVSVFETQNGSWFKIKWDKVNNHDEVDPILGYKVTVWEKQLGSVYEMKDDGKMVEVAIDKAPPNAFDVNFMFEIQQDGTLVKTAINNLVYGIWKGKVKAIYRVKQDGTLEPPATENLVMNLRTDQNNKGTKIDVSVGKTEATYYGIQRRHLYEVAVQAYTAKTVGPFSKRAKVAI